MGIDYKEWVDNEYQSWEASLIKLLNDENFKSDDEGEELLSLYHPNLIKNPERPLTSDYNLEIII